MQVVQKYIRLFQEKLANTLCMQQAFVKAVWVAWKDGFQDGFEDGYAQGYSAALLEMGYDPADVQAKAVAAANQKDEVEWPDEEDPRIDVIGRNGNDGLHY